MLPDELKRFGQSLVSVALFSSNIYFTKTTDYFAPLAEEQPLLHTWSLAVEEQYYVLFPLFVIACWRFGKSKLFWITAATACVSLALAEWAASSHPIENFYLLPTRAWELLAGSLIAYIPAMQQKQLGTGWRAEAATLLGLAAIAYAVFSFDSSTPFPSLYALIPVIGTVCLLVFSSGNNLTGKVLSNKYLVGIGLISYSAYLWHQPLFAFARIYGMTAPQDVTYLYLSLLSLVLAWVSWKFVETPCRTFKFSQARVLTASAASLLVAVVAGGILHVNNGFSSRYSQEFVNVLKNHNRPSCSTSLAGSAFPNCSYGAEGKEKIIIVGDSHAENLIAGIEQDPDFLNAYHVIQATTPGCMPVGGIARWDRRPYENCVEFNQQVRAYLKNNPDATLVVLARWPLYLSGTRYAGRANGVEPGEEIHLSLASSQAHNGSEAFAAWVENDLHELMSSTKKAIWINPVPELGWSAPRLFLRNAPPSYLSTLDMYEARNQLVFKIRDALEKSTPTLRVVKTENIFCGGKNKECQIKDETLPLYVDTNHLSKAGAKLLVMDLKRVLDEHPAAGANGSTGTADNHPLSGQVLSMAEPVRLQ